MTIAQLVEGKLSELEEILEEYLEDLDDSRDALTNAEDTYEKFDSLVDKTRKEIKDLEQEADSLDL